jgi:hypothetical protein
MPRSGPAGLPGDVIATPLYHLPPRLATGSRDALGDMRLAT